VKASNAAYKRNPYVFSIGGWDGMHLIYEAIDPKTRDVVQKERMKKN
jgi:hypothetical protein